MLARDEADVIEKLDEVANAEGCPITKLSAVQVYFALTDNGRLALDGLGEETEREIYKFCYPDLGEALAAGKNVVSAVQRERERLKHDPSAADAPATELGRGVKQQLDMPTTFVNRIVSRAATRRLKSFKPRGKPS